MSSELEENYTVPDPPDTAHLVTEDDEPVDNIVSEKQQRLLTGALYSSWTRPGASEAFVALANVGLFPSIHERPAAPDVMLSLDVSMPADFSERRDRSYFVWEYGKVPDVVIEIVSNARGGELEGRKDRYERMRVPYYVVYDPAAWIQREPLALFELRGTKYARRSDSALEDVGLQLVLWEGTFERLTRRWLRWADLDGRLIPTGDECAQAEQERAEAEQKRAEAEQKRAEAAEARAEALLARLRALGVEPDEGP